MPTVRTFATQLLLSHRPRLSRLQCSSPPGQHRKLDLLARFRWVGLSGSQREASRSVSLAVEACTTKHKQAQQEVTATAAEALRRALEAVGEEEVARTKAVLGR